MKFWKHYFNALVPPLCLIAGLVVMRIAQFAGRRRRWTLGLLIALVLLPAIGEMVKHLDDSRSTHRFNVPLAIASQIKQDRACRNDLYVLNYDPLVYAYANAAPPTRYVLGIELSEFSDTSGASPAGEVARILSTTPCWIVVADPSPYAFTPQVWHIVYAALRRYRLVQTYSEDDYIQPPIAVRLYRRVGEGRL